MSARYFHHVEAAVSIESSEMCSTLIASYPHLAPSNKAEVEEWCNDSEQSMVSLAIFGKRSDYDTHGRGFSGWDIYSPDAREP
jgi:hypothetical protein